MAENIAPQKINPWMLATIILGAILAGILVTNGGNILKPSQGGFKAVSSAEGSDILMKFLGEVYSDKVEATIQGISEENGLYKVGLRMKDKGSGQETDGFVYLSRDGKMFIPQPININETLTSYRQFKAQAEAQQNINSLGVQGSPTSALEIKPSPEASPSPSASPAETNTNSGAPVQE